MRNTLICTVGTSLLNNLRHEGEDVQQLLIQENWYQLALWLLGQDSSSRVCGAEINSITSIINKGFLGSHQKLIFLLSDTPDGDRIGKLLKAYYGNQKNPIQFESVEVRVLKGLRDDNVTTFQREGLRNLVKEISLEVRKFDPSSLGINATGGYKAQISFAGMIGQALDIPVYYLFEKFSEVIELPPQPISLDLGFWLTHYPTFSYLESEGTIEKKDLNIDYSDSLWSSVIDQVDDYVSLSEMGLLFDARARLQFNKQKTTLLSSIPKDETSPDKKPIKLRDDHGKDILQDFAKRLCHSPYVRQIVNSLPYNPKRVDPILQTTQNGLVKFVLTWKDQGLGVCIQTTGNNLIETNTIALHLQEKYSR